MARLIFGCGYLGLRVARRWRAAGDTVYAVTRSSERAVELAREGLSPLVADVTRPETLRALPAVQTALHCVGHDRSAGPSLSEVYVDGLSNVLARMHNETERIVYISSTGVYGSFDGDWVNEDSLCHPERPGGRACLEAERVLTASRWGDRSVVLRLAGLYGPGRIPRQKELLAGEPIAAPAEGYLNLIHVDDAASVVLAAAERAPLPRLYVVSDGNPPRRSEYQAEVARLLGAPPPRFIDPPADSAAAMRAAADKRIDNRRMLEELGVVLAHPTYREGLASALDVTSH